MFCFVENGCLQIGHGNFLFSVWTTRTCCCKYSGNINFLEQWGHVYCFSPWVIWCRRSWYLASKVAPHRLQLCPPEGRGWGTRGRCGLMLVIGRNPGKGMPSAAAPNINGTPWPGNMGRLPWLPRKLFRDTPSPEKNNNTNYHTSQNRRVWFCMLYLLEEHDGTLFLSKFVPKIN